MFSSLKNRLRSRTRVTIVMFHDVLCFEESAPFSYTCGNFAIYGSEISIKPKEFQWIWCVPLLKPSYETEPNRDPVIRDQKSLPEVRNRPLLPRDWSIYSTFRNSFLIQSGNLQFYPFNIRYIDDTKLKIEKFSKSDVGVFWAVAQYGFRNLRFKHRGME